MHCLKELNGFEPGRLRKAICTPESGQTLTGSRGVVFHMCGKGIRQTAYLPAPHGIRLAGQGKRAGTWLANTACGQMEVENGVAIVGTGCRLVTPLGERCHSARCIGIPPIELLNLMPGKITLGGN